MFFYCVVSEKLLDLDGSLVLEQNLLELDSQTSTVFNLLVELHKMISLDPHVSSANFFIISDTFDVPVNFRNFASGTGCTITGSGNISISGYMSSEPGVFGSIPFVRPLFSLLIIYVVQLHWNTVNKYH